jgi:RND family efflux transporter MFP subunit
MLCVCLVATACRPKVVATPPPPPKVTVAEPIQREVVEWDEYTGRTEAVASVEVRARVGGYLDAVHFQDGTLVKKGDLLFTIDPRPYQATLDHAEAELERAKTDLELATSEWKRVEHVGSNGAVSVEEIEQRRTKQAMANAAVRGAEAAVASARLDFEYTQITAPIDGRIGRKLISEGNVINAGPMNGTLLTTIVSVDPMYCYIDANEQAVLKYIHLARTGERTSARDQNIPARFALADEKDFPHAGIVDFVDNRIDATTGTMRARVVFANPDGRMVPGLFLRVQIPGSGKYQALLVDDQAINADLNQRYVLTVGDKNLVQYVPVELGPIVDGLRVVRSGLQPGAKVIVNGLMRSRPGMPVQPEATSMDPRERAAQQAAAPVSGSPQGSASASGSASPSAPKQ